MRVCVCESERESVCMRESKSERELKTCRRTVIMNALCFVNMTSQTTFAEYLRVSKERQSAITASFDSFH